MYLSGQYREARREVAEVYPSCEKSSKDVVHKVPGRFYQQGRSRVNWTFEERTDGIVSQVYIEGNEYIAQFLF